MKTTQLGVLVLALALAAHARAGDGGAAGFYTSRVVDEEGRAVAGATVDCYYRLSIEATGWCAYMDRDLALTQRTMTDSNGVFSVLSAPGATLAVVKKVGLATAWKTWATGLVDSSDPVVLTAPAALAGRVVDENDKPVAGADVWVADAFMGTESGWAEVENNLSGKPARECFSARTGADGRFRIGNFPAGGSAGVAVTIKGKAQRPFGGESTSEVWPYKSGDDGIQLRVGPAGAVEGKAVVAETGEPLAGVKIKLEASSSQLYGSDYREAVESGADGAFRIPDLQPGMYIVTAFMPGQSIPGQPVPDWVVSVVKPESGAVMVTAGETARDVVINASKGALVQVSVVLTNDLTPVVGAPVWSGHTTVFTGINGMALFRAPVGRNEFSARKDWFSQHRDENIQAGQVNNVWIELLPAPTIAGIVRDPSGASVAGALVSFHPGIYMDAPEYSEVTADKNGGYEIVLKLSREAFIWNGFVSMTNCIIARDLKRNLVAIKEFVDIPVKLDLDLQPGVTLSGSVKDTKGAPITNATLEFDFLLGDLVAKWTPQPTKVNGQGLFSFPAMPQGFQYFIGPLTAKGYGTTYIEIKAGDTKTNHYEFPTFVLKRPDRKLAGQVLGLDGRPAAGATVNFGGSGQPKMGLGDPYMKTDSDGRFGFDAVCEGAVKVSAGYGNIWGNTPAQGGDTNVVVRIGVNLVNNW